MSIKIKRSRFAKTFQELTDLDIEKIKSHFIYEVLFQNLPLSENSWLKIQDKWQELQNNKTEYEKVRRQSSKWKLARDRYRNSSKGKRTTFVVFIVTKICCCIFKVAKKMLLIKRLYLYVITKAFFKELCSSIGKCTLSFYTYYICCFWKETKQE